jgi:hypothetical protein
MSTRPSGVHPALENHGLRLMIAVVGAAAFGLAIGNYPAAFLGPIIAVSLMAPGQPAPAAGKFLALPLMVWLLALLVDLVTSVLAADSDVLLAFFTGLFFLIFYADALKGPSPIGGLVLIVLVAVGTFSANAPIGAPLLVEALAPGALGAVVSTLLAHALLPAKGVLPERDRPQPSSAPLRESLGRTAMLMALFGYFIVTGKFDGMYILVTAVAVLRLPAAAQGGVGLIASNVIGGAIALVAATLIATDPSQLFALLLFAAVVLCLGLAAESGGARAQIAKGATSTAIILMVIALASTGGSEAYFSRVVEVALTVAYVLLGRAVLDAPPVSRPEPAFPDIETA